MNSNTVAQMGVSTVAPPLSVTVRQWTTSYLRYLKILERSPHHQDRVLRSLHRFCRWLNQADYAAVSLDTVEEYALWLMVEARPHAGTHREGAPGAYAAASRRAFLIDLRSFLKWCGQREYLPERAYKWVPIPSKGKKQPKRALNEDIACILRAASSNLRDYTLCALLLDFGPRATELATLRIEDCDLQRNLLKVTGKTGDRHVMISSHAVTHLCEWLKVRNTVTGYVFPGRKDGHLTATGVYQILKRLKQQAGVSGRVNPHAWRHAYITNSLVKGGNLGMTRLQAGHTTVTTTQEYMEDFLGDELRDYQQRVTSLSELQPVHTPKAPEDMQPLPRPTREELAEAIQQRPNWQSLGRLYGVSGVAVKKWAIRWDLLNLYTTTKATG